MFIFYLKHLARVADVDLHIVNFTSTENGRINISFYYVSLCSEALLADSLEALLTRLQHQVQP